jgi:hypothetical protein
MENREIQELWELRLADSSQFARFVKSLTPVKQRTLEASIDKILLRHGSDLIDGDLIKSFGGSLYEFRVGPTSTRMLNKAGEGDKTPHQKLALRVFLTFEMNNVIVLLGCYDKAASDSKSRQQSEISKARKLMKTWNDARNI